MKNLNKEIKKIIGFVVFGTILLSIVKLLDKINQVKVDAATIEFSNFPQNKLIDTTYFILKGRISDPDLELRVNNGMLISNSEGNFSIRLQNYSESNYSIEMNISSGSTSKTIIKNYLVKFNSQTKKYLEELKIQELKNQKEQAIQEYKSNVKLYGKKAARIKKLHADWSWEDCGKLAKNHIWIGMDIRMLVFLRGRDFHRNISNYGSGNQYQYCWSDYEISCFYDNNGDGKIDSYN